MTDPELTVRGARPLRGRLRVPGDKSISHRALLFAAMATGRSRITGLAGGDDVARTRLALQHLGVAITDFGGAVEVEGGGVEGLTEPSGVLDCGNSGTALRLLAGLLAGRPFLSVLTGDQSLVERPMARVVEPLRAMRATVDGRDYGTRAPLVIRGGDLIGCVHALPVASAQVKTALILAGLQADGTTEVVEPSPSRDHTERMLAALGAPLVRVDDRVVRVRRGAPCAFQLGVPGDPSSAAFWAVAATITPGSDVVLDDVGLNPSRVAFVDVLGRMGADIEMVTKHEALGEPVGELHVRARALHGTTIQGAEVPWVIDEIPALAVAAAFAEGATEIRDAAELRVKESDRVATVQAMLDAFGVASQAHSDGLVIEGGHPREGMAESGGDHRVAMAAAIAANAIRGTSSVAGFGAVASSYPEFAEHLRLLTKAR